MSDEKVQPERRRFLKGAIGLGTAVWLTPTIITVTASKGYARLSGGLDVQESDAELVPRYRRLKPRPRPYSL